MTQHLAGDPKGDHRQAGDAARAAVDAMPREPVGLVVVDHGSRREDANRMLVELARMLAASGRWTIVEPAHMELAEPSLPTAFERCVQRGARLVVVHPYFLWPGRHWERDIPALAAAAAARHPDVRYLVTSPLGLHPGLLDVITDRVEQCLRHAAGEGTACGICAGTAKCRIQ